MIGCMLGCNSDSLCDMVGCQWERGQFRVIEEKLTKYKPSSSVFTDTRYSEPEDSDQDN